MNGPGVSGRQPHIADADAPGSGLLTLKWGWLIIFQASCRRPRNTDKYLSAQLGLRWLFCQLIARLQYLFNDHKKFEVASNLVIQV
jgi:hypothetical protein